MTKQTQISKRDGGDLWAEIRKLYESKKQLTYPKIKSLLMVEFDLDTFPSARTVQRHAKENGWKKPVVQVKDIYDDRFWEVVKTVYESHVKITYRELKELVQNELQIDHFPTNKSILERRKKDGWESLKAAVNLDDAQLKRVKKKINDATQDIEKVEQTVKKQQRQAAESNEDDDEENEKFDFDDSAFDYVISKMSDLESRSEFLTMSARKKSLDTLEFIELSRKRMANVSGIADHLSDQWVRYSSVATDLKFLQMCPPQLLRALKMIGNNLAAATYNLNSLAITRQNNTKLEYWMRGLITPEDLRDDKNTERHVPGDEDDEIYEEQRKRLMREHKEAAEIRRFIESGGMQADIDAELERRADEDAASYDDDEVMEGEFEEIGVDQE